ncbi:MAG: Hsp20/alpha crystallin family protein [Euryarchaeota archaeon]|jgi:HSP20 family protein|nr:Hsp20/alpha crystallin family protein [Euryarchaeota archaeon]
MKGDDIWDDFFGDDFKSLNQRIEKMFSDLSDFRGPDVKTYGYTMYQGPDGIPHYHEFGDVEGRQMLESGVSEPFSDVEVDGDTVRVIVEIPGTSKEDIVLNCTEKTLSVEADTARRKFSKTLALPCNVKTDSARATYNNGILEVSFDIAGKDEEKQRIEIE